MTDEEIRQAIDLLTDRQRIELITRLDNGSKVRTTLVRASVMIAPNGPGLFSLMSEHEIIAFRSVREFNDVYSFKTKTISIHPSTYAFLRDQRVVRLLTYAKDNRTLTFAFLDYFDSLLDLGIGPLRRADFAKCDKFATFNVPDLKALTLVCEYTTKMIIDDLHEQRRSLAPSRINRDQNSLF